MIDGIKLYTKSDDLNSTISISDGIIKWDSLNGVKCIESAYLPIENWRQLEPNELKLFLASEEEKNNYQTIGLIQLTESFIKDFEIDKIRKSLSETGLVGNVSEQFPSQLKALEDYSKEYQIISEKQKVIGISCKKTSSKAVTFDYDSGFFIGLHIDSWFDEDIVNRVESRNRMCYNLGFEDRYLIFSNIPVVKMCRDGEKLNARQTIRRFLKKNHDLKCFKLKIRPFEAYIFPTENLIHDGRNKNDEGKDVTFTTISYFQTFKNTKTH